MTIIARRAIFSCLPFILFACFEKKKVLDLSEAENLLFLTDGRLIVSAGSGLYQVTQQANGHYQHQSASAYQCTYQGITQLHDFVFAVCNFEAELGNILLWADARKEQIHFSPFYSLEGMLLPNGLANNGDDTLYIANSPYIMQGGIGRLRFDVELLYQQTPDAQESLSLVLDFKPDWRNQNHGIYNANGLRLFDHHLYFTDLGSVKMIGLADEDKASTIYSRVTIFDDLLPYCGGVLVTDFFAGQVLFISENGEVLHQSPLGRFAGASSVMVGVGAGFTEKQLLVTERGLLLKPQSRTGNQLSVVNLEDEAVLNQCL